MFSYVRSVFCMCTCMHVPVTRCLCCNKMNSDKINVSAMSVGGLNPVYAWGISFRSLLRPKVWFTWHPQLSSEQHDASPEIEASFFSSYCWLHNYSLISVRLKLIDYLPQWATNAVKRVCGSARPWAFNDFFVICRGTKWRMTYSARSTMDFSSG